MSTQHSLNDIDLISSVNIDWHYIYEMLFKLERFYLNN